MKITEALVAEHVVFHNLFDQIERDLPRVRSLAEVKALGGVLEALMAAHPRAEDELLVAPLEHCLAQVAQQDNFHHEHEVIEAKLREVLSARSLAAARRGLQAVVAGSRIHFDKEERILFPLAERVLKAKTLGELGARWLQRRDAALA